MTRIHRQDGRVMSVTVLSWQPHETLGQRTVEKNGYQATIIKSVKKIKEFRDSGEATTDLASLKPDQVVTLQGVAKGKGFSGTIKRHHFHRGPVSHGSKNIRQPGSAGSMYPQHVIKGWQMPGRLGGRQTTVKTVVEAVLPEKNILLVRGAVPGSRKSTILVTAE